MKRLQDEFGSFGIEQLGGEQAIVRQLKEQALSPFEHYNVLRQRLYTIYMQTND